MRGNSGYQSVPNDENDKSTKNSPDKRKNRAEWASYFVLFVTSALVFTFSWYSRDEVIYVPVKTANETASMYFKKQVTTKYHGFFVCALTVFSVLIAAIVDRLTLVAEEIFHVESRYDGKYCKMLKACFSGMAWRGIVFSIIFASMFIIIYIFLIKIELKLDYLLLVFSGIGFGPLVQRLLKLDTQSEVHIFTILEKKGTSVSNILAWSYYLNDLKIILQKIQNAIKYSRWKDNLSSRKLIILLPLDGQTEPENLPNVDQRLSIEGKIMCQEKAVHVLGVQSDGTTKYFLFTFVSASQAIFSMSKHEDVLFLPRDKWEEEAQSCYQSLKKILSEPADAVCTGKCVLISYKQTEDGKDDDLVNRILETEENLVATDSSVAALETDHEHVDARRLPTSETTTSVEGTTGEEIHIQDRAAADSADRDEQNEGTPYSIDNEAHITDSIRAERHQPSNNTPPQTTSINSPSQASNNTPIQTSDATTQTNSIKNPLKPSYNTLSETSDTLPQTTSIEAPPQPSSTTPPQTTSYNTRGSMYSGAPEFNSNGGFSEHSCETPSYEMQSHPPLEVHRNQPGEQRITSNDEVVCPGAMGMSSIGDNVEGANGEIQNEKAMDIVDLD